MKKIFIILCLFASFTGTSQTNPNLSTLIDPAKNRGYLKWIGDASPQYRVNVYELQDTTMTLLSTQTTTNNYVKFQPVLFSLPNIYYQIISLNEGGHVVSEGEVTPNELCQGCESAIPICYIDCNGRSYAWRLTAYEGGFSSGWHQFMEVTNTYQHTDIEAGILVPYWQAFSSSNYHNLSGNHPYKRNYTSAYGDGKEPYRKIDINPDLPSTHRDKDNFIISDGVLVEKRMDQFQRMNGQNSTSYHPPLCADGITATDWANYFNNHADTSFQGATPIVPDWATYFIDTDQLACNPSVSGSGGGGSYNWGAYVDALHDFWGCVEESVLPFPFECDGILGGFGGFVISSIEDDSLSVRFKNANPDSIRGAYYLTSHLPETMPTIEKGLYNFTLYLQDGNAIPTVIEFNKTIGIQPLKDDASLNLIPNPIENNSIYFEVQDKTDLEKAVRIYDLYGNLVYSENVASETIFRTVDVSSSTSPAFIVSVIFQDGSIIQKTAVR